MTDLFALALYLCGGIALMASIAPLGCFVVWRRMAYFGDALAHSTLLGIALGTWLGGWVAPAWQHEMLHGVMLLWCGCFAVLLFWLHRHSTFEADGILGILAHSALALGIVFAHIMHIPTPDVHHMLFGDLSHLTWEDVGILTLLAIIIIAAMRRIHARLLLLTLHEDLARAEGIATGRIHCSYLALVTLLVALSVSLVGALLITALLIIPAHAARPLSTSPVHMMRMSFYLGSLALVLGVCFSVYVLDAPLAAMIIVMNSILCLLTVRFTRRDV
ncbi:MAG: metal ABC transporter permease [Alphaproteobacteria bacterium]|nr:MAG: metal ABC transporter permease [Alphaproteobacteria bacterium]TAF14378.1 MAG: metal ABC transporter permease [Alphaproteobacteria bacterium]TAF41468.1 MAG: metal ABC transporter permease [Alphaproteobacteria bacterium]TAF75718.1 MAG: metal ABC transporter permease [Alphaproteobacteria bacterium]